MTRLLDAFPIVVLLFVPPLLRGLFGWNPDHAAFLGLTGFVGWVVGGVSVVVGPGPTTKSKNERSSP